MSEYSNYPLYKQEVIRLQQFIENLSDELVEKSNSKDILIPFLIGSPMEDSLLNYNTTFEYIYQYAQLFPNYINNFISHNSNKKFIQIIIISPDNLFSDSTHKPYFTRYSQYNFTNTIKNEYYYLDENIEIKVNIFNCPVPCIETRNKLILRYQTVIKNLHANPYNITTYKQNDSDINFINCFYSSLNKLFSLVSIPKIKIVINSWASFKNLSRYANKYEMFPNILELANKYNIIATEWDFIDELVFTKIVSKYEFANVNFYGCYINYVNEDIFNSTFEFKTNKFVIDFNNEYYLKKL